MSRPIAVAITGGIGAGKTTALASLPPSRRRDGLERRDRPPPARDRPRGEAARSSSASGRTSSARTAPPTASGSRAASSATATRSTSSRSSCTRSSPASTSRGASSSRSSRAPRGLRDRGAAPVRGRGRDALRQGGRHHGPDEAPRGAARRQTDDRESRLLPDREKAKRADFVYVNTGTPDQLDAWVAEVMATLTKPLVSTCPVTVSGRRPPLRCSRSRVSRPWMVEASRTGTCGLAIRSSTSTSCAPTRRNYGLDPALLAAVVYAESRFDADVESSAGAVGLMQLLPETAKGIALRTGGDQASSCPTCAIPRSTCATAPGT